jgi:hypothetical protein
VGSGASLAYTGTGNINANQIMGVALSGITGVVKMASGAPSAAAGADVVAALGSTIIPAANTAAISGDVTKAAGSASATVTGINGGVVPASAACVGTNSSGQLIGATCSGSGAGNFSQLGGGVNTSAAMQVGAGASLVYTGSGIINANQIMSVALSGISGMVKMASGVPSAGIDGSDYVSLASLNGGTLPAALTGATFGSGAGAVTVCNSAGTSCYTLPQAAGAAGQVPASAGNNAALSWVTPMAAQLGDLVVSYTSPTVLTIGASCSSATPCNVRFGSQVFSITGSATATLSGSATGTAYVYMTSTGNLFVGHNLTITCSAGCTQQSGITAFPVNVIPVYTWTASNGTWNSNGGTDQRSMLSAKVLANGQGIVLTETPGQSTLAVDNSVIPTYLTNTATLNFSAAIGVGACASDQTMTVSGANTGDAVAPAWPSGLSAGLLGMMFVSSSNTVTVRLCNMSGSAITPGSGSYRATIVRNY